VGGVRALGGEKRISERANCFFWIRLKKYFQEWTANENKEKNVKSGEKWNWKRTDKCPETSQRGLLLPQAHKGTGK